jgi:ketosteroid isomerase-like protein
MMRWLIAVLMLLTALPAASVANELPDPRIQIEAAMEDSAEGWGRGDLDAFLAIYSDDPGITFTGAKGVERGLGPIRARYAKNYPDQFGPGERPKRTLLTFKFEDFQLIGSRNAHLVARWTLTPAAGGAALTGMTSLLFRRESKGWKIIADHSS